MPDPNFQQVIENARTFLSDIEKSLSESTRNKENLKFSFLIGNFYEFYESWERFNFSFYDKFTPPEDIETKIRSILSLIRTMVLQNDAYLWKEYIKEGINTIKEIKSLITRRIAQDDVITKKIATNRAIRYIVEVNSAIQDYESKFSEKFDPSIVSDLNLLMRSIEHRLSIKMVIEDQDKNLCSIKIESIDADKILDLYEEIKKLPRNSKERKKKKALLKIWTDIFDKETNKK